MQLAEAFSAQNAYQIAFGSRASPGPAGELTALPRPHRWIKKSLLLREGDGKGVEEGEKR